MSAARLDETARGVFPISATPFAPDGALDLDSVLARVGGRVPVVVGVSNPGLRALAPLANDAMTAGAAGVMVAPPVGIAGDDALLAYMTASRRSIPGRRSFTGIIRRQPGGC